jgi:hypothetical protein
MTVVADRASAEVPCSGAVLARSLLDVTSGRGFDCPPIITSAPFCKRRIAMFLGEKQITLRWQQIEDDTHDNVGEESIVINVTADSQYGLDWSPVSHGSDVDCKIEDSTTFTDSLGRRMMSKARAWFNLNKNSIANEDPEFAGYRSHLRAERESDRGWANRRAM